MKRLILIPCLLLCALMVKAQGIVFNDGTWNDVLKLAKEKNCPVFIDVYTSWCGPCKKMAKEIFTQKKAGDYFNEHFVNYKVDAEKGEGVKIASQFNVSAYPTCLFVTGEGKLVSSFMGVQTVRSLLREGAKAVKNYSLLPQIEKMDAEYKSGKNDVEFLKGYCQARSEFGEKGGQPLNDLLNILPDNELTQKENLTWIQSLTVYDLPLINRLVSILSGMDKKTGMQLNKAIMKAMSTFIAQSTEGNKKAEFEQLMTIKDKLIAFDPTNDDNGVGASMGGGMSYLASEQLKMSFYMRNKYNPEFEKVFLPYLQKKMAENPTDSLIARSDAEEKYYSDLLKSDTVSAEKKHDIEQSRSFMKLFSGVKNKLLSTTLYNAAGYYWDIHAPQSEQLKQKYIEWLNFFYALDRGTNIAIPASEKLIELGQKDLAIKLLQNLEEYLKLTGDPDKELDKTRQALEKLK